MKPIKASPSFLRRFFRFWPLLVLQLFILMWPVLSLHAFAEDAADLVKRIDRERAGLKRIETQIRDNKNKSDKAKKEERSLLTKMEVIDRRHALLQDEISLLELNIDEKSDEAKGLRTLIKSEKKDISKTQRIILSRLRTLYKQKKSGALKILFASQDYPDLLRKLQYLKIVAEKEEQMLASFKEKHAKLEKKQIRLSEVMTRMVDDRESLARKLVDSRSERKKKAGLLRQVRKERQSYKKAITEMTASSKAVNQLINTLEKRKKALRVVFPGRFSKARGRLLWPNSGKLLAKFGRQKHPRFDTIIYRKGIEISPKGGAEVKSVFSGQVVYADWFRGYGMMVMIDHGENYYSLYAHLAKLWVSVGDAVKKKHVIGEVGGTGLSQSPKLYFEIRHQGKPINPLKWLKKR